MSLKATCTNCHNVVDIPGLDAQCQCPYCYPIPLPYAPCSPSTSSSPSPLDPVHHLTPSDIPINPIRVRRDEIPRIDNEIKNLINSNQILEGRIDEVESNFKWLVASIYSIIAICIIFAVIELMLP